MFDFAQRSSNRIPVVFPALPAALLLCLCASPALAKSTGVPDPTQCFFVPQTGSVATPTEGNAALASFRTCPNNDGIQTLPNNARIKVVVKAGDGSPIVGIAATDICILFNGGTADQGFTGIGADSIIANSTWNVTPPCPDVRCIPADAPTDLAGVTYITLKGSTPGSPGVATRDPNRKWGHFDSDMPVYVLGFRIFGKLTSSSALGSYTLAVKNFDTVGGLDASLDEGEVVTSTDLTAIYRDLFPVPIYTYSRDFDNNGVINAIDLNLLRAHMNHDCQTPLSP
jgi:hypothetical protein